MFTGSNLICMIGGALVGGAVVGGVSLAFFYRFLRRHSTQLRACRFLRY